MNLDNFHDFLDESSNLHRVSYQELKSLVAAYPFSSNLRILLLLKSKFEKHPDFNRNLILAATYTSDRALLHKIMHAAVPKFITEDLVEQEEVLELMDLEKVEAIMSKEQPNELPKSVVVNPIKENPTWASDIFDEPTTEAASGSISVVSLDSLLNDASNSNEIEDSTAKTAEINEYRKKIIDFSVDNFVSISNVLEQIDLKSPPIEIVNVEPRRYSYEKKVSPLPKNSFASWLSQFEKDLNRELGTPDINQTLEKVEATKIIKVVESKDEKAISKKKKLSTKKVAEKSLQLNNTIVSETLAELLVKQERFDKAIEMYEKLSLKYPEKRHIFAAQIQKIKIL